MKSFVVSRKGADFYKMIVETKMASKKMIDKFNTEVMVHESQMDTLGQDDSLDMISLAVGWALANGMSFNKAFNFALDVTYDS